MGKTRRQQPTSFPTRRTDYHSVANQELLRYEEIGDAMLESSKVGQLPPAVTLRRTHEWSVGKVKRALRNDVWKL